MEVWRSTYNCKKVFFFPLILFSIVTQQLSGMVPLVWFFSHLELVFLQCLLSPKRRHGRSDNKSDVCLPLAPALIVSELFQLQIRAFKYLAAIVG